MHEVCTRQKCEAALRSYEKCTNPNMIRERERIREMLMKCDPARCKPELLEKRRKHAKVSGKEDQKAGRSDQVQNREIR